MKKHKTIGILLILLLVFSNIPAFASVSGPVETDPNNPKASVTYTCVDGLNCNSMQIKSDSLESLKIIMKGRVFNLGETYTEDNSTFDYDGWAVSGTNLYKFNVYKSYTPGSRYFPEGTEPDYTGDVIGYDIELIPTEEMPPEEYTYIRTEYHMNTAKDISYEYFVNGSKVSKEEYDKAKTGAYTEKWKRKYIQDKSDVIDRTETVFTGLSETETTRAWTDGTTDIIYMACFEYQCDEYHTVTQEYLTTYELTKNESPQNSSGSSTAPSKPAVTSTVTKVTVKLNTPTVNATVINKALKKKGYSKANAYAVILGAKVKKINKGTFKDFKNVKTITIKTKKLKKASVKGSLKGSKITNIKVKVGSAKKNKKYVAKYKKYFAKKNSGRSVKIS